jgi:excisionase family DNA binding protein
VTPAELLTRIERDLAELRAALGIDPTAPYRDSPYLTVEEAAAYCKVAVRTIYNHRRHIPKQPGIGKLLFTREALDTWLTQRKRQR